MQIRPAGAPSALPTVGYRKVYISLLALSHLAALNAVSNTAIPPKTYRSASAHLGCVYIRGVRPPGALNHLQGLSPRSGRIPLVGNAASIPLIDGVIFYEVSVSQVLCSVLGVGEYSQQEREPLM